MNPLFLAAGAGIVTAGGDFIKKNGKYLVLGGIGIYAFIEYKKAQEKKQQDDLIASMASNPAAGQAIALFTAMNIKESEGNVFTKLLGVNKTVDTIANAIANTDETALYAISAKITDWSAVSSAYSTLYKRNLDADLRMSLSNDEYGKFMANLNKGLALPSQNYESAKTQWQNSWKSPINRNGTVYNRYLGNVNAYVRTSEIKDSQGRIIRRTKLVTVNFADYIKLGTTDGTQLSSQPGWIKIIATDSKIIQLFGNSMFWIQEKQLMLSAPPARPK